MRRKAFHHRGQSLITPFHALKNSQYESVFRFIIYQGKMLIFGNHLGAKKLDWDHQSSREVRKPTKGSISWPLMVVDDG